MKNIIPFKKDVIFKTKLGEITSISLENNLEINDKFVEGNFIISGDYKKDLDSQSSESFNLDLPFRSVISDEYETENAIVDIDDFYYEITGDNTLSISIDVLVDRLEEKPLLKINDIFEDREKQEVVEENQEEKNIVLSKNENNITNIFNTDSKEDDYITYNICIIKEGDNIESILEKYNISKELLEKYNDLRDIKKGDKLIIPSES